MFRSERYTHNYPFGWRTGDPILYYAKNAWYIRTSQFRERMAALNQTINWVPEHIRDGRFGNWLENNIDWALSRERFWGTPLPVWTDGDGDYHCVGSVEELEALTGRSLDDLDLHRPAVDDVTFEKDGKVWRRVPEVIDCRALFGQNAEGLVEASKVLNGKKVAPGDAAFEFMILPKVPLQVILWAGDDEFPAEANILFDQTIGDLMSPEDAAWLAGMLAYRLISLSYQ